MDLRDSTDMGYNSIGNFLDVRLRNSPDDVQHHHWRIHNFKPTSIGDIELSHDDPSFMEFDLTGTFTHITYDCGHGGENGNVQEINKKMI